MTPQQIVVVFDVSAVSLIEAEQAARMMFDQARAVGLPIMRADVVCEVGEQ